jgi:primase-polymerase (primpol)-like protein
VHTINSNGLDLSRIPAPLHTPWHWVGWRREFDDKGKPTKRPYNPRTDTLASVTNPKTWSDFHTTLQSWFTRKLDGIGFVLTKKMGLTFVDLDHCINGRGEIAPWACDVLHRLDSFAERSPSGDGIHILIFAILPDGAKHTRPMGDGGKIELYDDKRYLTMTGVHLDGYRDDIPLEIEHRQRELDELYAELFPPETKTEKKQASPHRLSLSDQELIDRAMAAENDTKFRRLWNGDLSEYANDHSRGDLALCCLLAFWTAKDADRMDALFRQSDLMREKKWNRADYRKRTIEKAIELTTDTFDPSRNGHRPGADTPTPDKTQTTTEDDKETEKERAAIQEEASDDERWPDPLAKAALHGLAGDVVALLFPQYEGDLSALLLTFLLSFGNAIGRNAYYYVAKSRHYTNLFLVLVGLTGVQKGGAQNYVNSLLQLVDKPWFDNRQQSGLSSGEGLIYAVRDPIEKTDKDGNVIVVDPGVEDKRLLVVEEEFGGTLRVMRREGNTLSPTTRKAWDRGNLAVLNKNSPNRATDAHISIVGHITPADLQREMDSTEAANGFGNRFLWAAVKRSKFLPDGGSVEDEDFKDIQPRLNKAIDFARTAGRMKFDADAHARWHEVYEGLADAQPGLFGAVTGRAAPQVIRLTLIYALLDSSPVMKLAHLEAALAVWNYCKESAAYIFGDSLGNPTADAILQMQTRRHDAHRD